MYVPNRTYTYDCEHDAHELIIPAQPPQRDTETEFTGKMIRIFNRMSEWDPPVATICGPYIILLSHNRGITIKISVTSLLTKPNDNEFH